MARAGVLLVAVFGATVVGCVAEEGRRRARSPGSELRAPIDDVAATNDGEVAPEPSFDPPFAASSRTLRVDRFETVSLAPPAAEVEPRPRRRRSVDVDLAGAPFEDVARMLADVGGFGLVLEAPGAGTVQASLRRVDAWEALEAICHAKGLDLRYQGGIAIVKSR